MKAEKTREAPIFLGDCPPKVANLQPRKIFPAIAAAALTLAVLLGQGGVANAQDHGVTPADIERGGQTYLSNCAVCHGPNGDGITGVNLFSGQFRHATTDQDLVNIIKNGLPGTPMPPFNLQDAQAGQIVAYLRSQPGTSASSKIAGLRGDPVNGKAIFEGRGQCLTCHRVQGPSGKTGGFLGPDLSGIGSIRRSIDLERALTDPSASIRTDERVVRVVLKDGTAMNGRLLNQDTYSVQLIDNQGNLQSFEQSGVRSVEILTSSVMQSFTDKFTLQELADMVSYLQSLKAPLPVGGGRGNGRGGPAAGRGG
jgi:putative heme-binding domain-containing protein